jgi:hypothetical protein
MNDPRRTRRYFDEDQRPAGMTFDDGERSRRNMPWMRFAGAEWDHSDPATIRVEIADWQVVITGHNLEQLFRAIEQAKLARLRAYPEFADDPAHENDVFATTIRFVHLSSAAGKRACAPQLNLQLEA